MTLRGLASLWLTVVCVGPALADDAPFGARLRCWWNTSVCPSLGGSPDDYCRKPCPMLTPVSRCGLHDDYCRKRPPCLTDVSHCGGVDDYCRKRMPCLLCPPLSPYLQYGLGQECCAPAKHR